MSLGQGGESLTRLIAALLVAAPMAGLLEERTASFTGKVFLVHGDTHRYRIDQPLRSSETGERLLNFTRVETFGHPDVDWVRASVDPSSFDLIEFEPGSVRENG